MAICPECLADYGDDVETCPQHGCALVPDELVLPSDVPLAPGTMVGEYRIEKQLGAGTFGDVYAGEQPVIGKRVAVKVLNRRFASDPAVVSRFIAEARAVNRIRQRNIIDIFSFGVLPGRDRHYFVMELLDGLTLGALLERTGRLPVAHVLPIVRGIADALDAVHEAGITHRDLKPDNVFLAKERDGSYFPKLLDFGVAKLIGEELAHQTGPGMVLGTPRYMSPEQARGKPADHRADIYALGVMIHEMLTGGPLFVGTSAVDMLLKQAVDDPPRLSSVCPDLPPALDEPVLAMVRKRAQDRPPSAGRAVSALVACAQQLGLDHATVTLAELAGKRALSPRAPASFTETTLTIDGPRAPPATTLPRPDPMSRTERAPASNPEAESTLRSNDAAPVTEGPPSDGASSRSEARPTTDIVSTLETSSAIRRRGRARRLKVAAGSAAVLALGASMWTLGSASLRGPRGTSAMPASAAATVLPGETAREPLAPPSVLPPPQLPAQPVTSVSTNPPPKPLARPVTLATSPTSITVTTPLSRPPGAAAKPADSAGKLERILGGRE